MGGHDNYYYEWFCNDKILGVPCPAYVERGL